MAYHIKFSDYSTGVSGPPDPAEWIGPPGPPGPTGPKGDKGDQGDLSGGTLTGPLYYTATGGTVPRSAQDRAADVANVLDFGADPTGVADSTAAIRAAVATGHDVVLPSGAYRITGRIAFGSLTKSRTMTGLGFGAIFVMDADFDPTVTDGVIVTTGINLTDASPAIRNISFHFNQPADLVTAATAASASGTNTVTVASVAGLLVGMTVCDATTAGVIPTQQANTTTTACLITSIAGNVVTLSQNIRGGGVVSGDQLHFAPSRAMFQTLANGGTTLPGGTGVQYPWAIYNSGNAQTLILDQITVVGAWNGIYVRGSSFNIGSLRIGAFNVGLDVDNCLNFSQLRSFSFWTWGYGPADPYGQARQALLNVYYDGTTVAANFGRCDGLAAASVQSWVGIVNLTANFTWGTFTTLNCDGIHADLNIVPAGTGWVQIGSFYSTKPSLTIGHALVINPVNALYSVTFGQMVLYSASATYRGLTVFNGLTTVQNGYFWHGLQHTGGLIVVGGGTLAMGKAHLTASAAQADSYIVQSGTGVVQLSGLSFDTPPGAGAIGVEIQTDRGANFITNNIWSGWGLLLPAAVTTGGALGYYIYENNTTWQHYGAVGVTHGLTMGNFLGASTTDLTRHIQMHTSGYGMNVQGSRLNYTVPSGGHYFNVAGTDAFFVNAAGGYATGSLAVGGVAGPTWTSGSAAPASTQPKGSIYTRTGGAVGSTLYVTQGAGTWNPVAGV